MAICEFCNKEMLTSDGCSFTRINIGGKKFKRIKVQKTEVDKNNRCYDCGAKLNNYHHVYCDIERCLKCGHQLLSCSCNKISVLI